jgi:hypothetical protein
MSESEDSLAASVEKLVGKMEKMYERQLAENDKMEKMMASLDSLSRVMAQVESEKKYEAEFNRKIEFLNESLQRVMNTQLEQVRASSGQRTIDKIVQGTKIVGQVLSAVATGIQFSVDNVGMVLKKEEDSPKSLKTAAEPQSDLSMLLQPLNSLVKNFVDEKKKQQELPGKKPEDNGDEPAGRE